MSIESDAAVFNTASLAFTPKITQVVYKKPSQREKTVVAPASTLSRPNYEDNLRRVSIVIHQHILRCESILKQHSGNHKVMKKEKYITPKLSYKFNSYPIVRIGFSYNIVPQVYHPFVPTVMDVHDFLFNLFVKARLTPECSIVCLIYVERLMELGNVPLVSNTWKPCVLCGLLLASKVWQDIGSWNIEISDVLPEYSVQAINQLERAFCSQINWNLYISSSVYAKYYFALRSLAEKNDFRRKYNISMLQAPGINKIEERTTDIKLAVLSSSLV